ncbi:hypothetical protein BT93_F0825 [Corymbia citriodora subsp. variegata]|nr:hypothetical protein BT93_F0825 [Corymbia citriodora subsp. variegata]
MSSLRSIRGGNARRLIASQLPFRFSKLQDPELLIRHVLESSKRAGDFKTATKAHARIIACGYWTNPPLLASLVSAYVRCHRLDLAERVVHHVTSRCRDLLTLNIFLRDLLGAGQCGVARKLFDKMPERDVVTWNSMIGGLTRNGRFHDALASFRDMLGSDVEPDGFTFASVFTSCARVGFISHASWAHGLMIEKKIEPHFILNAALIDMYARCGKIQTAREIFNSVHRDDVSVWNSMINGLAIHGHARDALTVFSELEQEKVTPDSITFVGLLTACSRCGLVEEGRKYFDSMRSRYSIQPEIQHYGAMVDLLARAGSVDEAYAMIKEMPMKPDAAIWRTLLSSCRVFKRSRLGEVAIAHIPCRKSGDYVLLSNTYCSLTRWDSAAKMRNLMKRKGVGKNCGKSWVEFAGEIHQFRSGDRSHRETDALYEVLDELIKRTKMAGFVPSMELVLMDVADEEKEENLNFHSEKLAVAYGVLKSSPGSEIVVLKNLRICYDCHCWIKLVSRILSRTIVVRDRLRFHQFEGGLCSCNDYW